MNNGQWFEFDPDIFQDSIGKGAVAEPFLAADLPEQIEFFKALNAKLLRPIWPTIRVVREGQ